MSPDSLLKVYKMSGAGNTFALVDARDRSALSELEKKNFPKRKDWVQSLCDPRKGLGTDGALFIQDGRSGTDYVWDFYNADGSGAEMCGNAARCAALFCRDVLGNKSKHEFDFLTGAGVVKVRIGSDSIFTVDMTAGLIKSDRLNLLTEHGSIPGLWIDTGVPHFVVPVSDLKDLSIEVCRTLRFHREFGSAGANVTLLKANSSLRAQAVTYERGVENFTAACGTGAVAAALALGRGNSGIYEIQMPGGELRVNIGGPHPQLIGPAVLLGEYLPTLESLK